MKFTCTKCIFANLVLYFSDNKGILCLTAINLAKTRNKKNFSSKKTLQINVGSSGLQRARILAGGRLLALEVLIIFR